MRITESQLRNIIKKELKMILMEITLKGDKPPYGLTNRQLSLAMQFVTSPQNIRFRDEPDPYGSQSLYPPTLPAAIAEAVHGSDQKLAQDTDQIQRIRNFLDELATDPREPSSRVPKGKLLVDYYYNYVAGQKANKPPEKSSTPSSTPTPEQQKAQQTRTDRFVGRIFGKEFVNK